MIDLETVSTAALLAELDRRKALLAEARQNVEATLTDGFDRWLAVQPESVQRRWAKSKARPIEEVLAAIAAEVPPEEWDKLPADLTDNLDHYIYGTAKKPPTPPTSPDDDPISEVGTSSLPSKTVTMRFVPIGQEEPRIVDDPTC